MVTKVDKKVLSLQIAVLSPQFANCQLRTRKKTSYICAPKFVMMEFCSVILSTAYLPPIQYFSKLLCYDEIIIEKHETYTRQTYRNRCEIYSANGRLPLSIPVIRPSGNHTNIAEVKIDYSVKWQREHWRALESAYKNSAYFELIMDDFLPFFVGRNWEYLWDYNKELTKTILSIMDIKVDLQESIEFVKKYPDEVSDFRFSIHPKPQRSFIDSNFTAKPYFQVFADRYGFIPNLSVFDVLCNCGKESLAAMG